MANRKDMRRDDLIVPYVEPEKEKNEGDMQATMASTLPMAAIFTRNKMIGWAAVIISVQTWLSEGPAQKATQSTPGYFSVGMALLSLSVTYVPLFMPPTGPAPGTGSDTGAPVPVPA
ncbi:hypothetical protein K431DRAFT_301509 [Polychaeton citri CBS 116435]|uniref:Protein Asterix n=1 Tax=Polychaeton citri CBS 116435 TaxID=1314669 RepID=A0A9P4QAG5_9PEZI|nr:hypothetical protein K431DRAFT_301509 [Polychaeton citri CBS 116435]